MRFSFPVVALLFGFLVTTLAFPPLFMAVYGKESWGVILTTTLSVFAATYLFFVVLLEVQLFRGIITLPLIGGWL